MSDKRNISNFSCFFPYFLRVLNLESGHGKWPLSMQSEIPLRKVKSKFLVPKEI